MKISELAAELELKNINGKQLDADVEVAHAYTGDLLSFVLANAKQGSVWLTIQNHMNVIGVASMAMIPAVVVCDGVDVADDVAKKADEENILLYTSAQNAFTLSGKLYECGIR